MSGSSSLLPEQLGLCHGSWTNNLPSAEWLINEFKELKVKVVMLMMLGTPDRDKKVIIPLLNAFVNFNLKVKVVLVVPSTVPKDVTETAVLKLLAKDPNYAADWVDTYVSSYKQIVTYVCLGALSELSANGNDAIQPTVHDFRKAMDNVHKANATAKFSVVVDIDMLINSDGRTPYNAKTPPSSCKFQDEYEDLMKNFLPLIIDSSVPLFASIMPYFRVSKDGFVNMTLSNYLMNDDAGIYMKDGKYGYKYVYDAMFDSIYCAMDKLLKVDQVDLYVVTGWPTLGASLEASLVNQKKYIVNLNKHVTVGTPMKPGKVIKNNVYCLVDQNLDPRPEVEWKHFGIVPSLPLAPNQ